MPRYDCWIWGMRGKVTVEAEDIREASKVVRSKYPGHNGFFLARSRDNLQDPAGLGIECESIIPLSSVSLTGYNQL